MHVPHRPVPPSSPRNLRRGVSAIAAVVIAAALSGCTVGHPAPATSQGATMAQMWNIFYWVGIAVAGLVYALFIWSMIVHRRKRRSTDSGDAADDELPPQFDENTKLELVYTVIPLLIVLVLFVLTFTSLQTVEAKTNTPDLTVKVLAFDWSWQFDYDTGPSGVRVVGTSQDPPTLRLPAGKRVRFLVRSRDVAHSFYIPAFLFKRDAIPGIENSFDVTLDDRTGTYPGHCAEYCGLDHAYMLFNVEVMSPQAFDAWQAQAAREAAAAPSTTAPVTVPPLQREVPGASSIAPSTSTSASTSASTSTPASTSTTAPTTAGAPTTTAKGA